MNTISSCLIVKDAVKTLPRLVMQLSSFSDEIIINDTGSIDGTLEFLQQSQNPKLTLIQNKWEKDFAKARNQSFAPATMEWVFWVDSDDMISDELIEWMQEFRVRELDPEVNTVILNYRYGFNVNVPNFRLIKDPHSVTWHCRCHEYPDFGPAHELDATTVGDILHMRKECEVHYGRNLDIYVQQICDNEGIKDFSIRDMIYYGNELLNAQCPKAFFIYSLCIQDPTISIFDLANTLVVMATLVEEDRATWDDFNHAVSKIMHEINTIRFDGVIAIALGLIHKKYFVQEDLDFVNRLYKLAAEKHEEVVNQKEIYMYGYDEERFLRNLDKVKNFLKNRTQVTY